MTLQPASAMTEPTLAEELRGKRFGLVLSAGYFGFFGHAASWLRSIAPRCFPTPGPEPAPERWWRRWQRAA